MVKAVIDGREAIYIVEEAEQIGEYNSVRIFNNGEEILNPKDIEIVFYNDEEQE